MFSDENDTNFKIISPAIIDFIKRTVSREIVNGVLNSLSNRTIIPYVMFTNMIQQELSKNQLLNIDKTFVNAPMTYFIKLYHELNKEFSRDPDKTKVVVGYGPDGMLCIVITINYANLTGM
jgi:hypothetical protein